MHSRSLIKRWQTSLGVKAAVSRIGAAFLVGGWSGDSIADYDAIVVAACFIAHEESIFLSVEPSISLTESLNEDGLECGMRSGSGSLVEVVDVQVDESWNSGDIH